MARTRHGSPPPCSSPGSPRSPGGSRAFRTSGSTQFATIDRLMALMTPARPADDIAEILVKADVIAAKVKELGVRIAADYQGKDLVLVSILKGARPDSPVRRRAKAGGIREGIVMARITLAIALAFVVAAIPRPAAAAPLAALPATVRVNVSGLGTAYARIGSTSGVVKVTNAAGAVVYSGNANTITRLGVRRLAEPGGAAARIPDPVSGAEERRNRGTQPREAKPVSRIGDVPILTVPFEFSLEREDPLAPPLFASQTVVLLKYTTSDGLLSYNGRVFRGTLELAKDDEGDMIVVNEVDTASYLASVVGSEEPTTWMPEALASQAIAARTYLVTHLHRHGAYDLEGDTRDQEYDGLGGEDRSTVRAVERTAGMVATYGGAPIEALYSANAGGITEDSENVYANALPYLRSVPSPGDQVAEASAWGHTSWQ